MPTLTLIRGKEYGRTEGEIPTTVDLTPATPEEVVSHRLRARWEGPAAGSSQYRQQLAEVPGEPITTYQGSESVNGLSLHVFDHGEDRQTVSVIGIPLEAWTGHRIRVTHTVIRDNVHTNTDENFDLVFSTDPAHPVDHSPSSIGPGHWHPHPDEWRRLKARVAALEAATPTRVESE